MILLIPTYKHYASINKKNLTSLTFLIRASGGGRMSGEEFCLFILGTRCKNKPHVLTNAKLAPPL